MVSLLTHTSAAWRKVGASFLLFLFMASVFAPAFLYRPQKAEAVLDCFAGLTEAPVEGAAVGAAAIPSVPVIDPGAAIRKGFSNFLDTGDSVLKCVLNGLAWMFAKIVIQQMTASIVQWINSGFEGSPGFLTDPSAFFLDAADRLSGEFIEQLGLDFLCDPFKFSIQLNLSFKQSSRYFERKCSISDVIANFENFTNGNFEDGGWEGWFSMTQNTSNNPYGSYIDANAALSVRINNQKILDMQALGWGKGFLSWQDCKDVPVEGSDLYNGGTPLTERKCTTETPGTVIESQLEHVLGSGVRQLELADSFNEIVTALMGQLVKQVMGGVGGLLGASAGGGSGSDPRSYVDRLREDADSRGAPQSDEDWPDQSLFVPFGDGTVGSSTRRNNVALRQTAKQSGTSGNQRPGFANDGITDGENTRGYKRSSVTEKVAYPFWEVNLGSAYDLDEVVVWRTLSWPQGGSDEVSAGEALGSFKVFYSANPIPTSFNPIIGAPGVFSSATITADGDGPYTVELPDTATDIQYVRIQRVDAGTNRLWLAEVQVFENRVPVITLLGNDPMEVPENGRFRDPGATARDFEDGDLTGSIEVEGEVNENRPGEYHIEYRVTDSSGRTGTNDRTVFVIPAE